MGGRREGGKLDWKEGGRRRNRGKHSAHSPFFKRNGGIEKRGGGETKRKRKIMSDSKKGKKERGGGPFSSFFPKGTSIFNWGEAVRYGKDKMFSSSLRLYLRAYYYAAQ